MMNNSQLLKIFLAEVGASRLYDVEQTTYNLCHTVEVAWTSCPHTAIDTNTDQSEVAKQVEKGKDEASITREEWEKSLAKLTLAPVAERLSELLGKEVNEALVASLQTRTAALKEKGITPCLGIIRLGENPSDLSYEKGATKRAEEIGVAIKNFILPEASTKEEVLAVVDQINADDSIHGCLMFRPLPKHLKADQDEICNRLAPKKDVDSMTHMSNAGVFEGQDLGYAPCTPAACMEILDYYGIDCKGKNAVVIGRSLVVGKPAAMMLMAKNATVTICHTRTVNTAEICKNADIIVTAAGVLNSLTKDFVREGQIVIDVSMNWNPEKITSKGKGGMSGDCIFDEVEPIVEAITPVPGGVGAVTTSVLMKHVVEAAEKI